MTADVLDRSLQQVRDLSPSVVLSSHLPVARGMTDRLLSHLQDARGVPFGGPDQQALQQMLSAA